MAVNPDLKIYNTLSRKEERFVPLHEGRVDMFVCGQTVYDDAHLGHAKNYIDFSIVARWLRHIGYEVRYVQNITDVDDKIIARAKEKGQDPIELARQFEARFFEDMDAIGVRKDVSGYPRSHDFMDEIKLQIQLLLDRGYAYVLDGDVYYDVARFADYAKLSGVKMEDLEKHRIEPREGKRNAYDFALWKASKPGEPSWKIEVTERGESVVLEGRPGWHIEDTAMTHSIFGAQYDLHGGAAELIFPHHSNEIAQAEAAFGKVPFVRYWMHAGVLRVNGEKMSKSLGNFIKIRDFLKKHVAESLRLLICSTHYRKEINYTDKLIGDAEKKLRYMYASLSLFYNMEEKSGAGAEDVANIANTLSANFHEAMNGDFNTSLALSELYRAIESLRGFAESNKSVDGEEKGRAIAKVLELAGILGILQGDSYKHKLPDKAVELIRQREGLRKEGKYKESDEIRDRIRKDYKIVVEDSEYGTLWYGA